MISEEPATQPEPATAAGPGSAPPVQTKRPVETKPATATTPATDTAPAADTRFAADTGPATPLQAAPATDSRPEAKAEPETGPQPEARPEPEARTEPGPKQEPETKAEAEAGLESETKPEPGAKPEAKAEAEPEAGLESEAKAEPEAKPEAEAEAEPEPDRWSAFAPEPERRPGLLRRAGAAFGRALVHEWTLVVVGALLLAVVMTWPTLKYPAHTIPQDIWDPTLQAWQLAWSGHTLLTDPGQLWHANSFYPERYSFAFTDSQLGYAPAGMIGTGPLAAVLRYNIIYVLLHALAFVGAYALVRQLGAGRTGAAVAGAAFAYAPWRLSQAGHLHVISTGGIALALAMLARGHGWSLKHGYRPEKTHAGWAMAGWLVATWQISIGFGIGLPFAYILAVIVLVTVLLWLLRRVLRRPRRRVDGRLLLTDLVGMLIFAAVGVLLALPYLTVADQHPEARRTVEMLRMFSPPLKGFFIAPAESRVWGGAHADARATLPWQPEMTLLPGFALYALAVAGLFFSIWTVRQRILLLAGVVVSIVFAMGTQFFDGEATYLLLFHHLPGWDALRTSGRLVLWTTLLLGVLAAGAVSAFVNRARELAVDRVPGDLGPWLRAATLVPLVLVLVEGLNTTPHPIVPEQPAVMRTAEGPLMVLPSDQLTDMNVMLWSTDKFQPMVNGGSGFVPVRQEQIRQATHTFPDMASVNYLRELGVKAVIVLRGRVAGTPWQGAPDAPVEGLDITREEVDDAVVFHLSR